MGGGRIALSAQTVATVTATLEGFEATKRAIAAVPEAAKALAADAIAKSTFAVEQAARARAPRGLTGRLRAAITSKSTGTAGRVGIAPGFGIGGRPGPEVYWRFVEYGTVRMPARPMFRPAAEQERDPFIRRMRDIGPKLERDLSRGRTL
jgi:HK97 gp10 family phage protein